MDGLVKNKAAVTLFEGTGISVFLKILHFLQSVRICTECVLDNKLFHQSGRLNISLLSFVILPIHQIKFFQPRVIVCRSPKNNKGRLVAINFELVKSHRTLYADHVFLHWGQKSTLCNCYDWMVGVVGKKNVMFLVSDPSQLRKCMLKVVYMNR